MKLAMAYIGINRLDGAAECLTCVARACAKPGTEGIERGLEVLGNEECLSALRDALKGPPVSSDAWDGASVQTTSRPHLGRRPTTPACRRRRGPSRPTTRPGTHSTLGSRPGSRQRRNRSRPGSALNTPRRPGSRSRSRPGRAGRGRRPRRPKSARRRRRATTPRLTGSGSASKPRPTRRPRRRRRRPSRSRPWPRRSRRRERECQELLAAVLVK